MPVTAGLIIGGASLLKGGFDFFSGRGKEKRAKKGIDKVLGGLETYSQDRYQAQTYQTPEEISQIKKMAETRMNSVSGLPGEDIYRERIGASQTGAMNQIQRTASDPSSALGAITNVYGRTQASMQDLSLRSAEYKAAQEQQRTQNYYQALQTGAQYDNMGQQFNANQQQAAFQSRVSADQNEYQYNVVNPAQARISMYGAQMGQGMSQQQSGMNQMFSAPLQGLQAYMGAGGSFGNGSSSGGMFNANPIASSTGQPGLPGMGGSNGYKGV